MSNCTDGPARGQTFTIARAPYFLRVVQNAAGTWDALDLIDDAPKSDEQIHVYRRTTEPMVAHVDGRDPKTGRRYGRWMAIADYRLHPVQPDDDTARDNQAWQAWCQRQIQRK